MHSFTFFRSSILLIGWPTLCLICAMAFLYGCAKTSSGGTTRQTTVTVRLQDIAIHPKRVRIGVGSSVRWVWLDSDIDTSHNVTPRTGGAQFKASGTRLSGSYTVRFAKRGTYRYECTIHPASMQGSVVVQ